MPYNNSSSDSLGRRPKTPSPGSGEPPMQTSPLKDIRLQRSNAIRRGSVVVSHRHNSVSPATSSSSHHPDTSWLFPESSGSGGSRHGQGKGTDADSGAEADVDTASDADTRSRNGLNHPSSARASSGLSRSSGSSSGTDRSEANIEFAQEVYFYKPGPARFYTQYNNAGRTATQQNANRAAAAAAAQVPRPGPVQPSGQRRSRFLID